MPKATITSHLLETVNVQAPGGVFERGRALYFAGAVIKAKLGNDGVSGEVEGSRFEPYQVALRESRKGWQTKCTCPYTASPACKHAVALAVWAVDRYAGGSPEIESAFDASEIEIAAQKEIRTRRAAGRAGGYAVRAEARTAGFSRFTVSSRASSYEVIFGWEGNAACTCPDYLENELGTCKHIDLVRAKFPKRLEPRDEKAVAVVMGSAATDGENHVAWHDLRFFFPTRQTKAVPIISKLMRECDARGYWTVRHRTPTHLRELLKALRRTKIKLCVSPKAEQFVLGWERQVARTAEIHNVEKAVRAGRAPGEWERTMASLSVELTQYQVEGVLFTAAAGRALLADDMGLGKTIQALALSRYLEIRGELRKTLVICPASLKSQWVREAVKVLGPGCDARVVGGGSAARRAIFEDPAVKIAVTNYESVGRDLAVIQAAGFDLIILDEAQRIKNWETKAAKTIKTLRSPFILVLTGTPLENRLSELYSVMQAVDGRALGPMWRFTLEHGTRDPKGKLTGLRNLGLLRKRLATRALRREKSLVLSQLPPRRDQIVPVEFTPQQRAAEDAPRATVSRLVKIAGGRPLSPAETLRLMQALTQMRMIANGLLLVDFPSLETRLRKCELLPEGLRQSHPSPKLAEFANLAGELLAQRGTKIVVFSQWERMLHLARLALEPVLSDMDAKALMFSGKLDPGERAAAVAQFHDDPAARVFFSTDAGGVGLNLQEAASTVIHIEPPWNPAVFEQRVGRVMRMGQRKPVQVYTLISQNSFEISVLGAISQKRAIFDGVFRQDTDELTLDGRGLIERVREMMAAAAPEPLGAMVPPEEMQAPPEAPLVVPMEINAAEILRGIAAAFGIEPGLVPETVPVRLVKKPGAFGIEIPDPTGRAMEHLQGFLQALGKGG